MREGKKKKRKTKKKKGDPQQKKEGVFVTPLKERNFAGKLKDVGGRAAFPESARYQGAKNKRRKKALLIEQFIQKEGV